MAQRGIREYHGKKMMTKYWSEYFKDLETYDGKIALIDSETTMEELAKKNPWLKKEKLVVKPDQLIGKRGKHNLILLDATFEEAKNWINERMNKEITIGKVTDKLSHFLIEPFVPHDKNKEFYIAITSNREGDAIHFSAHGGVDIEEVWTTVVTIQVPILSNIDDMNIKEKLPRDLSNEEKDMVTRFIKGLFKFYADLGYAYLEINPITVTKKGFTPLDTVARLDDTAQFVCGKRW
jgi:ATP-citrate lyase beta-subunit